MSKRKYSDLIWRLLKKMPDFAKGPLLRHFLTINNDLPSGTIIKKAETFDELKQAFKIAFEAYRDMGLIHDQQAEYRATKYHILPTTSVLVLKIEDEVIGTLSVVVDSALGLPLEDLFNITKFRENSSRIAEVSTLAIKRGYRRNQGLYLFPLFKYMYELSRDVLGIDCFVIATHPRGYDFYRHLLGFEPLDGGKVKSYEFVNGAPAIGQYIKLKEAPKLWKKMYKWNSLKSNMYDYMVSYKCNQFYDKKMKFNLIGRPILTAEEIEFFFMHKNKILDSLNKQEQLVIQNLYRLTDHKQIAKSTDEKSINASAVQRTNFRYHIFCNGNFKGKENINDNVTILEASENGVRIHYETNVVENNTFKIINLDAHLAPNITVPLRGRPVWVNPHTHQAALQLIDPPTEWRIFIEELDAIFHSNKIRAKKKESA